jgi:TRAP-type C4-dicarboxylate transport system permease small subunit
MLQFPALRNASDRINDFAEKLLLAAGCAISIILFLQVVARYIGASLSWSEEVGRHLLVTITFLGGSVAYKRATFIGLKGIGSKFGVVVQEVIVRFLLLLTLACFGVITWFGVAYTVTAWEQMSSSLQIPMSIPFAFIPLSAVFFVVHILADICGGKHLQKVDEPDAERPRDVDVEVPPVNGVRVPEKIR